MPSSVTTGKNIGVKISTAGVISIKVPIINRIILIISRIIIGLSEIVLSKSRIRKGTSAFDIAHDIPIEEPINNKTIAVVITDSRNILGKSFDYRMRLGMQFRRC